jgi:hypothetical protein
LDDYVEHLDESDLFANGLQTTGLWGRHQTELRLGGKGGFEDFLVEKKGGCAMGGAQRLGLGTRGFQPA